MHGMRADVHQSEYVRVNAAVVLSAVLIMCGSHNVTLRLHYGCRVL